MNFLTGRLAYKVLFLHFFVLVCLCGNSRESQLDDADIEISSEDLFNSIKVQKELVEAILVKEKEYRQRKKQNTATDTVYKEPTYYAQDFEPVAKTKQEKNSQEYLHLLNQYQNRRKRRGATNQQRKYESNFNVADIIEKERKKRHLNLNWLLGGWQDEDTQPLVQHEPMPHWPVKKVKRSKQRRGNVP